MTNPSPEAPRDERAELVALGAYLHARRKARGLTHAQAAQAARMSIPQISRIEGGLINTSGTSLALLLDAVGGSLADVLTILRDPDPTPEKARDLAEGSTGPGRLASLVEELERDAARDPELLAALAGFLAGRRSRW